MGRPRTRAAQPILRVLMVAGALGACERGKPTAGDNASGANDLGELKLALTLPSGDSIDAIRFVVTGPDGSMRTRDVPLEREPLPPGADPALAGRPFADWFLTLRPRLYRVEATPLDGSGAPSAICTRAEGTALVRAHATTELVLGHRLRVAVPWRPGRDGRREPGPEGRQGRAPPRSMVR